MLVVGHRGAAARAPENTAASLQAGLDAGSDVIEIDVGITTDGRVVVLHDTTVDRTTNGRGALSSMTWAKASSLDAGSWFHEKFKAERLIDLDDALAIVRARVPIIVEIKAGARDRDTVDGVLGAIRRTGGFEGVTISSSEWALLDRVRERAPGADVALTVRSTERQDPVARAKELGASALHPSYRLATDGFIGRAHDAGLIVIPYTVNSVPLMRTLAEYGADGLFTDDPAAMKRALRRSSPALTAPAGLSLGIDQGSGGTRAVLVSAQGTVLTGNRVAVASTRQRDGSIVQDAEAIAQSVLRAAEPIVEAAATKIAHAGLAVQRSSLVVWRRSDARPVTPVLSWRAGAPYEPSPALLRVEERIERATGLTVRFPYGAVRLAALCADRPELARQLADGDLVAGPLGAFLAARLGGAKTAPCDPSLAQRTLAFDLHHGAFTDELAEVLGVPKRAWASVAASVAPRGSLKLGRSRVPLTALAGDVGAAARAALAGKGKKTGVIVLGTGGFVVVPTGGARRSVQGLLTTLLWENGEGPRYAIEGTVHGLAAGLVEAAKRGGFDQLPAPRIAARAGSASRTPVVVARRSHGQPPRRSDATARSGAPSRLVCWCRPTMP